MSIKIQKSIICAENNIFGILLHVVMKIFEWLGDVIDHSVVIKEVVIAALSELSNDTKQTVWKKIESNDKLKEIDIKKCICYYCMCYWWHN